MRSMQEALTEALEHPAEEHRPHSNKPHKSRRVVVVNQPDDGARAFLWGAIGSFIGIALVYRAARSFWSNR